MSPIEREIRFESDRDPEFAAEIRNMPGCELINRCIQCATCSGFCPFSTYMDITPRRIIQLTRSGFKDDVLNSNTIWLCSSCYSCQVECPKEIGITDVMYALKTKAIEAGIEPKNMGLPRMYRQFHALVSQTGRVSETRLVVKTFASKRPMQLLAMRRLGLRLMKTGRFSLKLEKMERPESLHKTLKNLLPLDGRKRP